MNKLFTQLVEKRGLSSAYLTPKYTDLTPAHKMPDIKKAIANDLNTLGIGKDVSYSRCMAPLTADNGFEVSSFKIKASGDANWTTNANYTITNRAYAYITEANIEI